ncbi:molybdenum cofactor biosynthesis protein MoaE [Oerskovia sp. NPDC060338]|uniref:molybdenum cofactor biosynthesis protein MoaE n=1 Tax=Oerskovia sp. NPDC060338 TaxID=3347100 RepID=UPI0036465EFD
MDGTAGSGGAIEGDQRVARDGKQHEGASVADGPGGEQRVSDGAAGAAGGAGTVALDVSRVTKDALDDAVVRAVEGAVSSRECGAVVTFRGVVRDVDGGRDVTGLDYEAHPDATEVLRRCCAAVSAETGLCVAAVHRYGVLTIGDVALVASVASGHRAEAFAACSLLVERIKAEVPIWKRQHFTDGDSEWVGL